MATSSTKGGQLEVEIKESSIGQAYAVIRRYKRLGNGSLAKDSVFTVFEDEMLWLIEQLDNVLPSDDGDWLD